MLSGKAVKRAVRGHYLMDSALKVMLLEKLMTPSMEGSDSSITLQPEDFEELKILYDDAVHHRIDLHELSKSATLSKLNSLMTERQCLLAEKSRTAKLWLQYCRYVDVIKSFIRAERLGDCTQNCSVSLMMMTLTVVLQYQLMYLLNLMMTWSSSFHG